MDANGLSSSIICSLSSSNSGPASVQHTSSSLAYAPCSVSPWAVSTAMLLQPVCHSCQTPFILLTAPALEDCPAAARGIISGMLQQGYAFGYLLATVFARAFVNTVGHGWRPLFWFGAGPPVLIIIFRLCLPETQAYQERKRLREEEPNAAALFVQEGKHALKQHWLLLIYMVLLMAGFNFMSHGSQDLYPTMLSNQYDFSPNQVSVTQVVANLGAMAGGTLVGYSSSIFGRRLSIIVMCILGGALLYPYTFVGSNAVIAA